MKMRFLIYSLLLILYSCNNVGEVEKIDGLENTEYVIEKVSISPTTYVYVAKYKNCPEVLTTTQISKNNKHTRYYGYITDNMFISKDGQEYTVLSETDSIIVLHK